MQQEMLDVLQAEGLSVEFVVIAIAGSSWERRADGFDQAGFPVMIDNKGVYYIYGAEAYEALLIDKQGRLVTSRILKEEAVEPLMRRIRLLDAE